MTDLTLRLVKGSPLTNAEVDSNFSSLNNGKPENDGTGATGTWGISVSGNAATATNVAYSGLTGTVPTWNQNTTGNAATATLAATATNVAYSGLTGTVPTWNQNTTGNAATATVLQTARTIGGVSFNGSANINLPGVNTTGNQSTSGNAATATALQTARTIGGVSFNGTANINLPGVNTTGNQNTTGNAATATTATTATTANALNTANDYRVDSLGIGTNASGTTGEIRATNNITAYYSDDRLKTKLGLIEDALGKVRTLSGFYYEANRTAQDLGYEVKQEVGVSAQEVQAVMPEVVAPAPIDDRYLTVRYERLVPLLVEAIKQLDSQVQSLQAQLKD